MGASGDRGRETDSRPHQAPAQQSAWLRHLHDCVRDACLLEVRSAKPGNVTPDHEFADTTAADFERSALAIADVLPQTVSQSVGAGILAAIQATRNVVDSNTNLGIVLLLAPLAAVPAHISLADGVGAVLRSLSVDDAVDAFAAIRLAAPGGLGEAEDQDVAAAPTETLRECMVLAADRDLIARQYRDDFRDVLDSGLAWLQETARWTTHLPDRIAWVALRLMQAYGDSLIARKCGPQVSDEVSRRAGDLLSAGWPQEPAAQMRFEEFDAFLRADGHRRNPGTTADMIAAVLFAALRDRKIHPDADTTTFRFVDAS